jgi:hypothetical protein
LERKKWMTKFLDTRIVERFPFNLEHESQLIVSAYVGSISHNTYVPKSDPDAIDDVDILGAILPPANCLIGLDEWEHWTLQFEELDVTMFGLSKLVRLWLKSNPNVLGLLWLRPEHYLFRSAAFEAFVEIRDAFVSKQAHAPFIGYAMAQLSDIHKNRYEGYTGVKRKELVDRFGYDVKSAAHLIRLLRMGTEYLRDGVLNVYRTDDAEEIRAIKRGEWTLEQVQSHAGDLFALADDLAVRSRLPERPDWARINQTLVAVTADWLRASA